MAHVLTVTLTYEGGLADENRIEFYDVAQGLVGFQRSLALTTHLIVNNEIITQAPALKNAQIYALPSEPGSWKLSAAIVLAGGVYTVGTAPKDTPIGHLISSAYDYVISESLGFHVDYNKTLAVQIKEQKAKELEAIAPQNKLDSLVEKCEAAIKEMHRPIVKSETALEGAITANLGKRQIPIGAKLNHETYAYISDTYRSEAPVELIGRISSYNINTFRGRIFLINQRRPISFELAESARTEKQIALVTESLDLNAQSRGKAGDIEITAFERLSKKTERLKNLDIVQVKAAPKTR